jgi:hypothetical protein
VKFIHWKLEWSSQMAWKVGQVQKMQDAMNFFDGFCIVDERSRPLICFGYGSEAEAHKAASLIREALANAKFVGGGNK